MININTFEIDNTKSNYFWADLNRTKLVKLLKLRTTLVKFLFLFGRDDLLSKRELRK